MKGFKTLVVAAVALCFAQVQAASVTEDFESVDSVDFTGDGKVDVSDINAIINRILQQ